MNSTKANIVAGLISNVPAGWDRMTPHTEGIVDQRGSDFTIRLTVHYPITRSGQKVELMDKLRQNFARRIWIQSVLSIMGGDPKVLPGDAKVDVFSNSATSLMMDAYIHLKVAPSSNTDLRSLYARLKSLGIDVRLTSPWRTPSTGTSVMQRIAQERQDLSRLLFALDKYKNERSRVVTINVQPPFYANVIIGVGVDHISRMVSTRGAVNAVINRAQALGYRIKLMGGDLEALRNDIKQPGGVARP